MRTGRILLTLLRVGAGLQVVVGLALWSGHWYSLRNLHMAIGVAFVLLLWSIAIIALVQRRRVGLALLALLWGVVIVAVGVTQQSILPGDLHWIVRVLHLVIGIAAMPIGELLSVGARAPGREGRSTTVAVG